MCIISFVIGQECAVMCPLHWLGVYCDILYWPGRSLLQMFSVSGSAALRFDWLYFRSGLCQLQNRVSLMKSEETYCVYVTVWFCCVSVFVLHAWCPEGQKRPLDFLDWSYRRL